MYAIDVEEAETRLEELLDRAEQGETIVITRQGKRIARFCPPLGDDNMAEALIDKKP